MRPILQLEENVGELSLGQTNLTQLLPDSLARRRRIKIGGNAKVVTAVLGGAEFIQFLAALAVLHWTI